MVQTRARGAGFAPRCRDVAAELQKDILHIDPEEEPLESPVS